MAEWAFDIARNNYSCPKCKASKGEYCHTPKGKVTIQPHGIRVEQLTKEEWDRCKVKTITIEELLNSDRRMP